MKDVDLLINEAEYDSIKWFEQKFAYHLKSIYSEMYDHSKLTYQEFLRQEWEDYMLSLDEQPEGI